MRLLSIILRNYRVHRELSVTLDPSRTLIGGPNESGKSTLAEAAHRALFLKAKGNTAEHRSMKSVLFPGAPEVELEFEASGATWHLVKRFGSNGSARLTTPEKPAFSGDAAEAELARLLGVEPSLGGRRVLSQWAHLWITQGQSADDPTPEANAQQESLLRQLQRNGGAVAMQSELDGRVAARFSQQCKESFLQNGKARAGSTLAVAAAAAAATETRESVAHERVNKLQAAMTDYLESEKAIEAANAAMERLREEKVVVDTRLADLEALRRSEAIENADACSEEQKCTELNAADQRIRDLQAAINQSQAELTPGKEECQRLEEAHRFALQRHEAQQRSYTIATTVARKSRQRRDLLASWVAFLEKKLVLVDLEKTSREVAGHEAAVAELKKELAGIPPIGPGEIKTLRMLETDLVTAQAALDAMATGLELLAGEDPVWVNNEALAPGKPRVLTDEAELRIGTSLRLRISPGGGTTLAQARQNRFKAQAALQNLLATWGIKDLHQAQEAATRRDGLMGKINALKGKLEALGASGLGDRVVAAEQEVRIKKAEVARRREGVSECDLPEELAAARRLFAGCEQEVQDAESAEEQGRMMCQETANLVTTAEEVRQKKAVALGEEERRLGDQRAQLGLLCELHGDETTRKRTIAEAIEAREKATSRLAATRKKIEALQPELLASDERRLQRALEQTTENRNAATTSRAVATSLLRFDGSEDPQAELELAQAEAAAAQDHLQAVERKAEAIRLLDRLFQAEQRELARQYTRPLADKIAGYLQCLFGPGARANVTLEVNDFRGLELVRPNQAGGAFGFEQLSGGAREQVAAAVRLAMAEVLSADHDGSLPIVFDDAFAWSDPERVRILQRMLDLAASRGLQVIVLSCNPADYDGLGARKILLRAPAFREEPSSHSPGAPEEQEVVVSSEDQAQFLEALHSLGGKAGNKALCQTLGWKETHYEAVKDHLLARGQCTSGRGRGGSILLSDFLE